MFVALLILGCSKAKEEDRLLGDPDERIADTLAYVKNALVAAPYGWKAVLSTDLSGGYGFYMQFAANDRVSMLADLDNETMNELKESTYRVRQIMAATLSFDTFTYLTMLEDPDPGVFGGERGKGYGSDIEFNYEKTSGDTLFFEGRKFKKSLYLIKASAAEQKAYLENKLQTSVAAVKAYFNTDYNAVTIGKIKAELVVDTAEKMLNLIGYFDGKTERIKIPFGYTVNNEINMIQSDALFGNHFTALRYDKGSYKLQASDGQQYAISKTADLVFTPLESFGVGLTAMAQAGPYANKSELPMESWSASYATDWEEYVTSVAESDFGLTLGDVDFSVNMARKVINASGYFYQGPQYYSFSYNMSYTIDYNTKRLRFTGIKATDGNGKIMVPFMESSIFKNMKDKDFELEYVEDPVFGRAVKFTRADDPDYYFTWTF
ncbi:hypothetical protein BWD42_07540 [Sphingobacterium sp. CZ-UAM]|nr:hypothetical protein BWD42_07540 [Sphingobacterium sp. CZ-UAM]